MNYCLHQSTKRKRVPKSTVKHNSVALAYASCSGFLWVKFFHSTFMIIFRKSACCVYSVGGGTGCSTTASGDDR